MSFLNLRKRFLPAKRAWKVFTTQFRRKLHKLQRSKAIKKPNNPLNKTRNKAVFWNSMSLQAKLRHKRHTAKSTNSLRHSHRYRLQKRPAPLLINELLTEPISVVKEFHQPSTSASASKGPMEKSSPSPYHKTKLSNLPGTTKGNTRGHTNNTHTADDMWESLAMASPQMHGINERAEEFITRFRADMQLQEKLARCL